MNKQELDALRKQASTAAAAHGCKADLQDRLPDTGLFSGERRYLVKVSASELNGSFGGAP